VPLLIRTLVPSCSPRPGADHTPDAHKQDTETVRQRKKTVIWFVWSVSLIWLNEINQINQINKTNQMNQTDHTRCVAGLRCVDRSGKLHHRNARSLRRHAHESAGRENSALCA
jgi:hypothetical protein